MNQIELKAAIIAKVKEVHELARRIFPEYNRFVALPVIQFYDKGRTAGVAYGSSRVAFNLHVFAQDPERFLNDTVPHEIAHIVCAATGLGRGHDAGWKRVCAMLGGSAERCFSGEGLDIKLARQRKRYEYRGSCGTVVMLSDVMHKSIQQKGMVRLLRSTGGRLDREAYTGVCK
jgi:SprT protein